MNSSWNSSRLISLKCEILEPLLHNVQTWIEYSFVVALEYHSTSFSMHCTTRGTYRNGASVYIWICGAVEYCASENVTPGLHLFCPSNSLYVTKNSRQWVIRPWTWTQFWSTVWLNRGFSELTYIGLSGISTIFAFQLRKDCLSCMWQMSVLETI